MTSRSDSGLRIVSVLALASLGLGACGSNLPAVSSYDPSGPDARLIVLTTLDQRVARVSRRLLEANADLCPTVRLAAGWTLHSARQYSEDLRPFAEQRFGLDGDLPGVLAAPPGSAAAAAGIRQGDLVVAVNGARLDAGDGGQRPEYEGLAANIRRIDAALAQGAAQLEVRRGEAVREVTITPHRACGYEVQLNPSEELNARADGRRLFISTALAGFTESDDELAVILGHELAHHVLRHRSWNDAGGLGRTANTEAGVPGGGPGNAEQQADRVGLYLLARAGYDPAVAAPFWRRFGASNWRVRYPQLGHASAGTRARNLEAVAAEIAVRQAAGGDLRP